MESYFEKNDGACHIPLDSQITIYYFLCKCVDFLHRKIWLPWKQETDAKAIRALLGLQGLKVSRPKYSFKNVDTHSNGLIPTLHVFVKHMLEN